MQIANGTYKTAGHLTYSKKLYNEILSFIQNSFDLKDDLDEHEKLFTIPNDLPKTYNINYSNLPKIKVKIIFNEDDYDNASIDAMTPELSGFILLVFAISISSEENKILNPEYLKNTIKHELVHLTQYLISLNKKDKHLSYTEFKNYLIDEYNNTKNNNLKFIIKNYKKIIEDPFGYVYPYEWNELLEKYKKEYKSKNNFKIYDETGGVYPGEFNYKKYKNLDKQNKIDHDNDIVEFFPLLLDSFNEYDLSQHSKSYFNDFISGEYGSEETKKFWKLLDYNKNLKKRAIKELYKHIYNTKKANIKINYIKIATELGATSNKEIFLAEYKNLLNNNSMKFTFPQQSFIEKFGFNYQDIVYLYVLSASSSKDDFKSKLDYELTQGYLDKSYLNKNIKELIQNVYNKIFNLINNINTTQNLNELQVLSQDMFFFYYLINKCIFVINLFNNNIKDFASNNLRDKDKELKIIRVISNDNNFKLIYPNLIRNINQYVDEFGYDEIVNVNDLYNFYLASLNKNANYDKALLILYEYDNLFGLISNSLKQNRFNSIFNILNKIKNINSTNDVSFSSILNKLIYNGLKYFERDHILFVLETLDDALNKNLLDSLRYIAQDIIKNNKFSSYLNSRDYPNLFELL